jgi:hypothetical protein
LNQFPRYKVTQIPVETIDLTNMRLLSDPLETPEEAEEETRCDRHCNPQRVVEYFSTLIR